MKPSQLTVKKGRSLFQKIANWVRGNFFIPDPKVFWVNPSVDFLSDYLKQNAINVIITTGPPHSMHLIGLGLKRKNPALIWIADFRDPWSEWPFLESFKMTSFALNRHKKLEHNVLETANHVVTITPFYKRRFEILSGRDVTMITNGFDDDDVRLIQYVRPEKFTIRHVGIVYEMANPKPLIEALTQLAAEVKGFRTNCVIEFIGEVNSIFLETVRQSEIGDMVNFLRPVPHKELMLVYGSTSLLWLNLDGYQHAEGLLPGKLFEYMATGLPILGVGPETGDAAQILSEEGGGKMIGGENKAEIQRTILTHFENWKTNKAAVRRNDSGKYSRKSLTGNLVKLFK